MASGVLMQTRTGSSLVEVVIALLLLMVAVVGMQRAATKMFRHTSTAQLQLSAVQLAENRIDLIKLEPIYGNLPSYVATETSIPGFPNFRRTTAVVQQRDSTSKGVKDYRVITVQVLAPGLSQPVMRIHSVGAP